ncbi:MAG: hypothetical protein HY651_13450 [Acidobacteria bacterium]|nr:hypothetical protein [Acidobacteriota bacterium]
MTLNWRASCVTVAVILLCSLLLSCSLNPAESGAEPGAAGSTSLSLKKNLSDGEFQLIGRLKVDEFNDRATGKEIPAEGGQVVVRFNAEPETLSTWLSIADAYSTYISSYYVYDSLLWRDWESFELEPGLAERWTEEDIVVRKDGKELRGDASYAGPGETGDVLLRTAAGDTMRLGPSEVQEVRKGVAFTFYLRRDVRFHDGKPLTAADVKFSLDTIMNEDVDAVDARSQFVDLEGYELLDRYTIRVTFAKQYWEALLQLGSLEILPKHIYDWDDLQEKDPKAFGKRFNESDYHRKPVGTGPYRFVRWDTGQQVVLERTDNYWNVKRVGYLDRIIFKFISDPVPALQALKNGDVNFIAGRLTGEQYDTEMSDPSFLRRFAKVEFYTPGFCYVGWNMRRPPFNDAKVRQAMAYGALDRKKFLEEVMHGHGIQTVAYQYFFGPAYDHSMESYPYDPLKAKQLLLEAGWYDHDGDGLRDKNGQPFRWEYLIPSGSDVRRRRAALMKENLRKLGIDMTIRELEWATFIQDVTERKFDACDLCWAQNIESDPYQLWHTSQAEGRGSNYPGFGNAETDQLIEDSRRTLDDTARRKLFFRLDRILHEQQPYLFLYVIPELGAYDKRYRGVKFYKLRPGYDLTEWYLPEEAGGS